MSENAGPSSSCFLNGTTAPQRPNVVKSYGISIDSSKIHEVAFEEQPENLRALGVNIFDQDVFEDGVLQQVDEAIAAGEEVLERQRLNKELNSIEEELRNVEQKVQKPGFKQHAKELMHDQERLTQDKNEILQRLQEFDKQKDSYQKKMETEHALPDGISQEHSLDIVLNTGGHEETDIERLVRLGEMTPFGGMVKNHTTNVGLEDGQEHCEDNSYTVSSNINSLISGQLDQRDSKASTLHQTASDNSEFQTDWLKCTNMDSSGNMNGDANSGGPDLGDMGLATMNSLSDLGNEADINDPMVESDDDYIPDDEELKLSFIDDEQFLPEDIQDDLPMKTKKRKCQKEKVTKEVKRLPQRAKDDGDNRMYQIRVREFKLKKSLQEKGIDYEGKSDDEDDFWNEEGLDEEFDGGLKIPAVIWNKLFRFQKTGVKWLWELHCQQAGGIVGDEMGLGKTIQIIAFLAGLKYSKIGRRSSKQEGLGPVLIVCPATVLFQWVAEFHKWWPEFRVAVLHETGSFKGPKDTLITRIRNEPGVLLTTYTGVRLNQDHLLPSRWDYIILDEGHIIRNPDADVTLTCKQFRTPHRLVLSGSPMQNNLRELWSLFDFVYPGKLGTLPVFMQEFSVPITMGGYSNATSVQVQTAYKCACVLRDTINPYLLRRLKKDVKMKLDLPNKNEQVLFCRLTEEQTEIYKEYLSSRDVASILSGTMKVFPGLIMLRKICNHPDLTTEAGSLWKLRKDQAQRENTPMSRDENDDSYGDWKRAGKLIVVQSLLKLWKKQKHKVLLFTQTRQMLKILEIFVKSQGYSYCRMDGSTSISSRQPLIEKFNKDESIFVFLLTTRVGGLGVNLVGANRVIIYDPDWNPGTDMQARERAWRVGQKKDVTIYRLLTTGTIEEKIYHRQIFKQFLTNRVLKDPKQRRFFKSNDLFELFTLDTTDDKKSGTETSAIFAGLGCEVNVPQKSKGTKKKRAVRDENVLKTIQERTKEILKTQFSTLKEQSKESWDKTHPMDEKRSNEQTKEDVHDIAAVCAVSNTTEITGIFSTSSRTLNDTTPESNGQLSTDYSTGTKEDDIEETEPESIDTTQPVSKVSRNSGASKSDGKKVDDGLVLGRNENKKELKKKSKKRKRNRVEGIRIGQLSHSEAYDGRKTSSDVDKHSDDDYILRKLFKKSGVHSALQHDTIVNSGNADHVLVENEAKRVATQAAEALKRSRDQCLQLRHTGLPTWTGQSGVVGSPHGLQGRTLFGPKTKIQPKEDTPIMFSGKSLLQNKEQADTKSGIGNPISSTQLLARMRARNSVGGSNSGNDVQSSEQKYVETLTEVRNFIATGCSLQGRATTQEILGEFSSRLPVSDSAIFREMLRNICEFDREPSGEGYWRLKSDFT